MKIGLRVNKGDKEYKRVEDATVEIGIGWGQVASTITTWKPAMHNHHSNMVLEIDEMKIKNNVDDWRIRKLTPKECWRLMGYLDKDYDNAKKENSGTQLYKQAGNAIVKQVLMAIFSQLNIKGVKAWNDMTETEKRAIIKKTTMAGE
jgi:site-specific DNA-cytosine methylase